ncbi:MAG TPA: signal peptidase I [Candidatus Saccharimonadales bacterium]|nr:signal peptidase I [Candidatus Saccharimonadales bacterium]
MKLIQRILISLGLIILVGGIGALLLVGLPFTGMKALTVATGSMNPTIPRGSLVLMHRVPTNSLKVGDVITYANLAKPGTTITHRIVKVYKLDGKIPAFVTKGDSNPTADRPIVGGQVLGKSVWHAVHLGSWIEFIKRPYVLLPIIYIVALIVTIGEIKRLITYYKTQEFHYAVPGFERLKETHRVLSGKLAAAMKLAVGTLVVMSAVAMPTVHALLRSNTVSLAPNNITVAPRPTPTQCQTNGTNTTVIVTGSDGNSNVNVNNSTNQNSSTGNTSSSGGGNATSGNASNTNCTNINVTITNNH